MLEYCVFGWVLAIGAEAMNDGPSCCGNEALKLLGDVAMLELSKGKPQLEQYLL
jgi:hypothetical protein